MRLILRLSILALSANLFTACASVNVKSERLVRAAIVASEENRCSVHPAPCIGAEAFRQVNAQLYRVSLAGETYTKLARAGTAKPVDALTFAKAVEDALSAVAILDPTGTVSGALAKLNGALQKAGVQ